MAFDPASMTGKGSREIAPGILVSGQNGIGKTYFAAEAPGVYFACVEDGLSKKQLDVVERYEDNGNREIPDWSTLWAITEWIATGDHPYKTFVIDTIDGVEKLIWNYLCQRHNKGDIVDFGWQDGFKKAKVQAQFLAGQLTKIRQRGIAVILLAHVDKANEDDPELGRHASFRMRADHRFSSVFTDWSTDSLFARMETFVQKSDTPGAKSVAQTTGRRIAYTSIQPFCVDLAKSRTGLPGKIEFSWAEFMKHYLIASGKGRDNQAVEQKKPVSPQASVPQHIAESEAKF